MLEDLELDWRNKWADLVIYLFIYLFIFVIPVPKLFQEELGKAALLS